MRLHSANELRDYGQILAADAATVLIESVSCGLQNLSGRRLDQAQLESALTTHMILFHFADVAGELLNSCYIAVDTVTFIVDYKRDPRQPRPGMWLEVYCHLEGNNL